MEKICIIEKQRRKKRDADEVSQPRPHPVSFFIPAGNEPSGHVCMSIWQLPRGGNPQQFYSVTSIMPAACCMVFDFRAEENERVFFCFMDGADPWVIGAGNKGK